MCIGGGGNVFSGWYEKKKICLRKNRNRFIITFRPRRVNKEKLGILKFKGLVMYRQLVAMEIYYIFDSERSGESRGRTVIFVFCFFVNEFST